MKEKSGEQRGLSTRPPRPFSHSIYPQLDQMRPPHPPPRSLSRAISNLSRHINDPVKRRFAASLAQYGRQSVNPSPDDGALTGRATHSWPHRATINYTFSPIRKTHTHCRELDNSVAFIGIFVAISLGYFCLPHTCSRPLPKSATWAASFLVRRRLDPSDDLSIVFIASTAASQDRLPLAGTAPNHHSLHFTPPRHRWCRVCSRSRVHQKKRCPIMAHSSIWQCMARKSSPLLHPSFQWLLLVRCYLMHKLLHLSRISFREIHSSNNSQRQTTLLLHILCWSCNPFVIQ